ncbi:MAG: alkaline phosphatase family protein [Anaerolineales bacterium]|jgi:hypothetical protein
MGSVLLLFLDGVGLGAPDPTRNPLVAAELPTLKRLMGGQDLTREARAVEGEEATFFPCDANLGVEGKPQSASGQASLLTGVNVPSHLGFHYGPKPNRSIRALLKDRNLLTTLSRRGQRHSLLNAYPPAYFEGVRSGHRLHSAIPLAVELAGGELANEEVLRRGSALSADFTGDGWRRRLGYSDTPLLTPREAGQRMAELARRVDFAIFDHWPTDYAGHKGRMEPAVELLRILDKVLEALAQAARNDSLLVVVTSDHGNLEDLSERGHTRNPVPALLIGPRPLRKPFVQRMQDLTGFAPALLEALD